jgi:glyoxylase-like metal-dependent hydrolase (beta-lactamase superfamily II)
MVILFGATLAGFAQDQDFSKVEIKAEKVAGNVWMLTGEGGNIGVSAGEDGVVLIDDQFEQLSEKIRAAVKKINPAAIRFVINTHCHQDHVGGNEKMGNMGAVIVAHENVRRRMSREQFIKIFKKTQPPYPKMALPIVTFSQDVDLHLNGDDIHVFHVGPAHTDTDSVIHFKDSNAVHMGDNFFNGLYPFIDADGGGSSQGVVDAGRRVLAMIDGKTKVIPGHGPLGDKKALEDFVAMLADCRGAVEKLMKEGKTLADIQAAGPTKAYDAKWGKGFFRPEKFVEILYNDLSKSQR